MDIILKDRMDPVALLRALIAIPSYSREEGAAADFLEALWREDFPQGIRRIGHNILIQPPQADAAKPWLLLNSHIDTVRPVAGWQYPPHEAREEGGKLYGLGSNDAGGALVALYEVFRRLCGTSQPYNPLFLASAEEEVTGSAGAEQVIPLLPHIALAVVGEPTGMQPAIAEKGLIVLDCTSEGRAGHAAREEGLNAITQAIQAITWFHTYRFPKESPLLGSVKMTVTQIEAGSQHNVVPDRCRFVVDVRTNEYYTNREIYDTVSRLAGCKVEVRSFRLNSSRLDPDHALVQRALATGLTPYGSPTLSDQAVMPFPSLKMGPGDSCRSHTADEYILLEQIREAIPLYMSLLSNLPLL
ncbi:MAG: M20/M25/M40 family metallo-hydrolase [Tannerellaceae bacterium]|jgi:acetylornithine deacetylase|nr:M20/M25/M40 family metallo-hydrolase [Tannerellaceae bacterium]